MRGYQAISDWAQSLGPKARERFNCRREYGRYVVPSNNVIRDVLIRVNPVDLDQALQRWNQAYGITSRTQEQADVQRVLETNRLHWSIENSCHYIIGWNYDEDRSRISTGYGPENMTRFRRFAVGIIKSKGVRSLALKMRQLTRNTRLVFDYLRMTKNSCQLCLKCAEQIYRAVKIQLDALHIGHIV
jgi:hypothetical protein